MEIEGNNQVVSGVAYDKNIAKVTILHVPDQPGMAALIFGELAKAKINVDMIIQSEHQEKTNDISFTVTDTDLLKTVEIVKIVSQKIGAAEVLEDKNVAKISIVGVGMISTPGVAASMFEALSAAKINIQTISTSEIKVSCVVQESEAEKAVKVLHQKFRLDKNC